MAVLNYAQVGGTRYDFADGANVAPAFSSSTAYAVGDYVINPSDGLLYQFTTAHAAGAWDSSHVTRAIIGESVSDLKSQIGALTYAAKSSTYVDADGVEKSNAGYDLYIATVPSGAKIKGTCSNASTGPAYICFYDGENKKVSTAVRNPTANTYLFNYEITVPDNAKTVKISHRTGQNVSFSIEIADVVKWVQQVVETGLSPILIPDMYSGTDTYKIQSCIDALAETGGIVLVNRTYTLTGNVLSHLKTDSDKEYITFVGVGKNAGINCGAYYFSYDSELSEETAYGGLRFYNINFTGTTRCFLMMEYWIRMVFENCRFYGFANVLFGGNHLQNVVFDKCYFAGISDYVINMRRNTVAGEIYALTITNCICEGCKGLIGGDAESGKWSQVVIQNNTIEDITGDGIELGKAVWACNISGNYFENVSGACIDMGYLYTSSGAADGINISGNLFNLSGEESIAIIMPSSEPYSNDKMHGIISGNHCSGTLLSLDDGVTKYNWIVTGNGPATDISSKVYTYTLE